MMQIYDGDLNGREFHGGIVSGIQKCKSGCSKSMSITFIRAIYVAERSRFGFPLWKSSEVTRSADFSENNIAQNIFCFIPTIFGLCLQIEI